MAARETGRALRVEGVDWDHPDALALRAAKAIG